MIKKDIEKNNRERKQLSRMNEKTLNPEKYLLKKKSERERLRLIKERNLVWFNPVKKQQMMLLFQFHAKNISNQLIYLKVWNHFELNSLFLEALRKPYRSAQLKKASYQGLSKTLPD